MTVHLYTIAWNERRMLPFFLRHYEPWVDRFVVYDDGSDDGTAETLARHPKVEVRPFPPKQPSFVAAALTLWEHAWKESRGLADWVVVTNVDEFFHHPGGAGEYLRRCRERGVTMIHPRGYEMVGDHFPEPGESLVERVRHGVPMVGQDKRQVFDPRAIGEMRYMTGRHLCDPHGRIVEPDAPEAALLHYKYVDPRAYTIPRQQALARRLLEGDVAQGFGWQYRLAEEQILASFGWLKMHATDVVSPRP